jgi:hypothetical protein
MDSQILRLLIISLLITVSFCLTTPLANFTGTLPSFPQAQVIGPFDFTGYPGPALIEIQAVSSVIVCVTPLGYISSNLGSGCPNPIYFDYNTPAPVNEFLLFLDDFSMNFIGQEAQNQIKRRPQQFDVAPFTPLSYNVSLLQNTPYYVSIGLVEDVGNNETLATVEDFVLTNMFSPCGAGSVPDPTYDGIGNNQCQEIQAQLAPNTSHTLHVTNNDSTLISFDVTEFSYEAQLDFHIFEPDYDLTIYIAFNFAPSETNYDFFFSNSSQGFNFAESDFLGDFKIHSFSHVINNPKTGTYYALITSNSLNDTNFNVEFNTSDCNPTANDCGTYNITTYGSTDIEVMNITFTTLAQYLAVVGESLIFGIDVNNTGSAFVQMDVNSIPTGTPNNGTLNVTSSYQYTVNTSVVLNLDTPNQQNNFVFALVNADTFAQTAFTALVWTGSQCPGNCSSNGNCDVTTTLCTCNKGFNGRYCQTKNSSHKKLSTLYIILIIIGSAIVLAILIGVPVALFLNNRKKARYERV